MKYVCLAAVFIFFISCGIEEYPYIYPIPTGNISKELNSRVRVTIPQSSPGSTFTNYIIYYRIYISDLSSPTTPESDFSGINSTLYSDHQRVRPYIENEGMSGSSVSNLFRSINYYPLALEGTTLEQQLGSAAQGKQLVIEFSRESENQTIPYLTLGGARYNLLRHDGQTGGEPYQVLPPNRYFINTADLRSQSNIENPRINGDVTDKPNVTRRYTYVSMYIVATGLDNQTYVQLFSSPTHIGVLQLAD